MNIRKKKGSLSYFATLNPGDPEKDAERFNNSTADVNISNMAEDWAHQDVRYMSDMLGDLVGNMPEDQLDNDLRLFARIARKLHVRNMDDLVVMLDRDSEYDPQYYVTEVGQKIGPVYKGKDDAVEYEMFGAHFVAENTDTGLFLYFPDETSGRKYVTAVDQLNEGCGSKKKKKLKEASETAERTNLIDKIRSFGKNYDFDKYTNQQLFRIANRLQDAADIENVIREFEEQRNKQAEEKAYDAEYDIPDETYEESLTVREKLGRLDEQCLDGDKYFDLRNMFEAVSPNMTPEEKEELRKVVNSTNDPDIISAYLTGKYKEKNEDLKEDYQDQLFNKLKQAVLDFLDLPYSMEWDMPKGYIYTSWEDWIDDTKFSVAEDSVESAQNLLDEYKRLYEVDKRLAPRLEDWETDEFIRVYENMKNAFDAAIDAWEGD